MASSNSSTSDSPSSSIHVPAPPPTHVVSSPAIGERFDGTNYVMWKTLLIPFLKANHQMEIVDGSEPAPPMVLASSSSSTLPLSIQHIQLGLLGIKQLLGGY